MKRFFSLFCVLIFLLTFSSACSNKFSLNEYVSELRSCLYEGRSESYTIKAGYGFKESPFVNDGKVGDRVNLLSFKLVDKQTDDALFTLKFTFNGDEYKSDFKLNPLTGTLTCDVEVDNFNEKEFTVQVLSAGKSETINMTSIIPDGTISYSSAIKSLQGKQGSLISHYTTEDGIFNAEIYARILINDGAPYWYIGIASGNDNLKALLVDGKTAEILAIREIF